MDWESKGGLDMSGNLVSSLSGPKDSLEFKLILYIILGVVALVIIHVLIDGIRRYIIGLDSAVLGGLLVWLGIKAQDIAVISVVSNLLYLIGGTLLASGLVVFVLVKIFRHGRKAKEIKPGPVDKLRAEQSAKENAPVEVPAERVVVEDDVENTYIDAPEKK
jgi:membrane protein implicated in regulation of membrane protease activity